MSAGGTSTNVNDVPQHVDGRSENAPTLTRHRGTPGLFALCAPCPASGSTLPIGSNHPRVSAGERISPTAAGCVFALWLPPPLPPPLLGDVLESCYLPFPASLPSRPKSQGEMESCDRRELPVALASLLLFLAARGERPRLARALRAVSVFLGCPHGGDSAAVVPPPPFPPHSS